ncbi:AzlC family ABC transporter permease [Halobacillus faecis]|uniref:Autotransporter n=1 Tax=Halobacillus faecis TaxID=360184 RepID=A0A511WRI5_9BACI|nr:AzlC family ABC transporter permease [Halobacillus faecis]GEN53021.1 autotransporter [Halobacillus faecis]
MEPQAIRTTASSTRIHMIKKGMIAGFPIMLGYLPIALTYGVLASRTGMTNLELTLMSVLVFAGAAQFLAVGMIAAGTGIIEIIIATFVLNFRHFVMSLSFVNRLKDVALKVKLPLSLGLTDETFTMSALYKDEAREKYGGFFYASLILTAYLSWVGGSYLGGVLGDVIPARLSDSMGVALYAMFIGLLIPSVKKNFKIAGIAVLAMLINFICQTLGMSQGWSIVMGTVLAAFSGVWILEDEEVTE